MLFYIFQQLEQWQDEYDREVMSKGNRYCIVNIDTRLSMVGNWQQFSSEAQRLTDILCCFIRGAESLLSQGKEWEKKGEYNRAIDMYVKITPNMTTDHELVEDAMVKVSRVCYQSTCRHGSY